MASEAMTGKTRMEDEGAKGTGWELETGRWAGISGSEHSDQ